MKWISCCWVFDIAVLANADAPNTNTMRLVEDAMKRVIFCLIFAAQYFGIDYKL